jgi:threonyl-tRNA synthetase
VSDANGREATLSTVQLDFHQPQRFDLRYTGPDQARHRPVMVHLQLVVLPVTDAQMPAAAALVRRCVEQGLRAELAAAGRQPHARPVRSS